jgi:hypothetical protein
MSILGLKKVKFFAKFSKISKKDETENELIPNVIKKKLEDNLNDTKDCITNMKDELKDEMSNIRKA